MERNFNIDYFEKLLKEKSDEFRMYPNRRVWHSVYNNLHPGRKWPSVVMSITLISTLLLVGYLNTKTMASENNSQAIAKVSTISKSINPANDLTNFQVVTQEVYTKREEKKPNIILSFLRKSGSTTTKNIKASITGNVNSVSANNFPSQFNKIISENNYVSVEKKAVNSNDFKALEFSSPLWKLYKEFITTNTNKEVLSGNANLANENYISLTESSNKEKANSGMNQEVLKTLLVASGAETEKTLKSAPVKLKENILNTNLLTPSQKGWIENYALYNRPIPRNRNGKLCWQVQITPSIVYRKLYNNIHRGTTARNNIALRNDVINQVTQMPSYGLEAGAGVQYSLFKWLKIRSGIQLNFTRYNAAAYKIDHPVTTNITMIDSEFEFPFEVGRATVYSNSYGAKPTKLHNQTFQVSIPVGIGLRLAKYENLEWYVGSSIQPTFVVTGSSYLISSNSLHYVKETSLLNRFNLNAGFETYVTYKTENGITWQFGPEYRTQLFGTNNKTYSVGERLINYGFKFGISKKL